ncbi:hypothetical protein KY362_01525, partial [Candidatus Woesearchaeota archaeon]|nr:hypothetical protein [Candidatus Woesearchaeota archaeon]
PQTKPSKPSGSTSQQVDLVSQPSSSYVRPSQAAVATPRTSYSSSGGWWDDNKWIVLIVIADILLLAVGIAIVVALLRRRKG